MLFCHNGAELFLHVSSLIMYTLVLTAVFINKLTSKWMKIAVIDVTFCKFFNRYWLK